MDLVSKIDEALSSSSLDIVAIQSLFEHGGFERDNFQFLTTRRAILAFQSGDLAMAIAEAFAATSINPTGAENFLLLSHLLYEAEADDLALEMLACAVGLEPDEPNQQLLYLQRLASQRPGYLKFALPLALPFLREENVEATLDLIDQANLKLSGACWREEKRIGLWLRANPNKASMTLKAHWFEDDDWFEQSFSVSFSQNVGHVTAQIPWREGAEACTIRLLETDEVLPGSPLFGPVELHPSVSSHVSHEAVEVIIPIYSGLEETKACIQSVLRNQGKRPMSLTLILDCPPDAALRDYVAQIETSEQVNVLRNFENLGFTGSVSRALRRATGRDVVLLNADTVVPVGWIDRLHASAYAAKDIGTVTPLSNNGEIVSFPNHDKQNALPFGMTMEQIDAITREVNANEVVDLPVGVGFCMFIKADCLNQTGLLDSGSFGRGYGEETDFCMRARQNGWRSVCATDLFVVHKSSVSFGDEKDLLVRMNMPEIYKRHPEYPELMGNFLRQSPLKKSKYRLAKKILSSADLKGSTLVVAPSDWRESASLHVYRHQLASQDAPVFWLSEDKEQPNCLELFSDGSGGLGTITYHLPQDISDLLADLSKVEPTAVHWFGGLKDSALIAGIAGLVGDHTLHLINDEMMAFLDHPKAEVSCLISSAASTITYSTWGQNWAIERGFKAQRQMVQVGSDRAPMRPVAKTDDIIGVAIVDGFSCMTGFKKFLNMARYSAASQLPVRFFLFAKTIDDRVLTRTGIVTCLGNVDQKYHSKLIQLLNCTYAMSIAHEDDPYGAGIVQMTELAPNTVCFSGGCRSELASRTPNLLLLPRKSSPTDLMKRLLMGRKTHAKVETA